MIPQQSAELPEHHFLPGVPHCPLLLITAAPSIPVFSLSLFFSAPESFCLLETKLIETNGPLEPIQGDYAGLVGTPLISSLLTKCCKNYRPRRERAGFLSGFIHKSGSDKYVLFHFGHCHSLRSQNNCTVYKIDTTTKKKTAIHRRGSAGRAGREERR